MLSKSHIKRVIPETRKRRGRRLGRHIHHDPRSVEYDMKQLLNMDAPLVSKRWLRRVGPFDQGNLGSCTGNAMLGHLATTPLHEPAGWNDIHYNEQVAVDIYSLATQLDEFGGQYPPTDTGSSGVGVCKAAQQRGWIDNYFHAFDLETALRWISQKSSIIVGTNWTSNMFNPPASDILDINGSVEGGHEYEVIGVNFEKGLVECENSWTRGWGLKGRFYLRIQDLGTLLDADGDATVAVRNS